MPSIEDDELNGPVEMIDGGAVTTAGDALLILWQGPAQVELVVWMFEIAERLIARHPASGIVMLQVVLKSSSPPDSATRAAVRDILRRRGHMLRRIVTVPVGDALWSLLVRTIMRAIYLVANQSGKQLVASSLPEAVERMQEVATEHTPPNAVLLERMTELYDALGVPRERPTIAGGR
jgi:hypothetical protein